MLPVSAGRYVLFDVLARGGMATVHYGRLLGSNGFARTVAIKRLHAHLAGEPEQSARFLDEGRLGARVRHPNVVGVIDVISSEGEAYLVMEYVHGESLAHLLARSGTAPISPDIVGAVLCSALEGLHAAHEAKGDDGKALHIVHRDISPQNILVGADGIARVLDFGVAKATGRSRSTADGHIKGKLAYMAPEQLQGGAVDRRTDVFAAGVVLWEMLTGSPLFGGETEGETVANVLGRRIDPPSRLRSGLAPMVDLVVGRALQRTAAKRYPDARQMARELEGCLGIASPTRVAGWVESLASEVLAERACRLEAIEAQSIEQAGTPGGDVQVARLVAAARVHGETGVDRSVRATSSDTPLAHSQNIDSSRRRLALPLLGVVALLAVGVAAWRLRPAQAHLDLPSKAAASQITEARDVAPGHGSAIAQAPPAPDLTTSPFAAETAASATSPPKASGPPPRSPRKPISPPVAPRAAPVAPPENPNAEY